MEITHMYPRCLILAAFIATTAFAQSDTVFQVRYAANLNIGESYVDITNTGGAGGVSALGPGFDPGNNGDICVNVYAVDPGEELISCCSCLITPDATVNLGVIRDLTSNTLTGTAVTSVTVKLYATSAFAPAAGPINCNNTAAGVNNTVIPNGVAAWGTTVHPSPASGLAIPAGGYTTTETPFTPSTLSPGELDSLQGRCAAIIGNASGFGVCASCRAGALGATKLAQ
jgi:hypothetical protein